MESRTGDGRVWALMVVGALVVAGTTVAVLPRGLGYDPLSWMIWGREIGHLALDTRDAATAVKPFPMFVDTLLAPAGSSAPALWLLVARTGTFLSLALAFRIARRARGLVAGVTAAGCLAMADEYLGYLFVGGMSEPMAAAAVLAAVDCHLGSHRRAAVGFLVVAGLLRPEAWPALGGYGLWLACRAPAGAPRRAFRVLGAAVVGVAVPAVWFVLDWFGSRDLSRSAEAATHESQGGPLLSRLPGLATVGETWDLMSGPVVVLFLLGFLLALRAWRRRGRSCPDLLVWLGVGALGWLAIDALLAQGRLATGAPRYLLPGAALACVVAGSGVARALRTLRRRTSGTRAARVVPVVVAVGLAAVFAPRIVDIGGQVGAGVQEAHRVQALRTALPGAVAAAGGRDAIMRCGRVSTGSFERPLLAWQLDVPLQAVGPVHPGVTGTVIEAGEPTFTPAELRGYRRLAGPEPGGTDPSRTWTVLTTCPRTSH